LYDPSSTDCGTQLRKLFFGVVLGKGDDRLVIGVVLDIRAIGQEEVHLGARCHRGLDGWEEFREGDGRVLNRYVCVLGIALPEGLGHLVQRDQYFIVLAVSQELDGHLILCVTDAFRRGLAGRTKRCRGRRPAVIGREE